MNDTDVITWLNDNKYVSQIIRSYNKSNCDKYNHLEMLAVDKCSGGKKMYLGFTNKADKVKFIQEYKYNNLYEIITNDICKPYFDIDCKDKAHYITDNKVIEILNRFIDEFNGYFRSPITSDNIYCYAKRDDDSNLIKSIHIVISGFKVKKSTLKDFVDGINKQRNNGSFKKLVGNLDGSVYAERKLFSLPYQKKLGKTEYFNWFYCFDNDKDKYIDSQSIYHYLINDTKNCLFNDYKDNPLEYNTITESKILLKENNVEKANELITNDKLIKLNPSNIVDELLKYLPQKFYENSIWKHISRQIVLNKFNGYERWLVESANRTINFDANKNKDWGDRLDDKYATIDIQKHLDRLNAEYNLGFIWDKINYFTDELINWICKKANVSPTELKATIKRYNNLKLKNQKPINEIMIGNNYNFYLNKQILINDINQSIYHYGIDTQFNNQYGICNDIFKCIKQDEIIDEMNKFLTSNNIISGWKMIWGSGKTFYGVKTIIEFAEKHHLRVLALTENNNLNIEMTSSLGAINHLDIKDKKVSSKDVADAKIVISSLESLNNILYHNQDEEFDILILDEYESIINHFISTTFKKITAFEVSEIVCNLIRKAKKIICLDCDLSEERMNILSSELNNHTFKKSISKEGVWGASPPEQPQLFICDYNNWKDYNYIIHTSQDKMNDAMIKDIFVNNKRVLYPSNSKNDAMKIYKLLISKSKSKNINKKIMIISSEGVEYYINENYNYHNVKIWKDELNDVDSSDMYKKLKENIHIGRYASSKKDKLFKDVETALKELEIDILIYSPSMTCGISFGNSKVDFMFDKLYGYATTGSITARAYLQMVHRCRNLKDKEINLCINNGLTKITTNTDYSVIEPLIMKHQQLKFCDDNDKWWNNIDMMKFNINSFYKKIIVSNVIEKINSERNYSQELIGRLIVNHNLNVSIKHIFTLNDDDDTSSKNESIKIKKIIKNERILLLQHEPKITDYEYNNLVNETNDNDGVDNRHKINKKYLLDKLNINNSTNIHLCRDENIDIVMGRGLSLEMIDGTIKRYATSGIFTNYYNDADGEIHFYNQDDYCGMENIKVDEYDKDLLIQHSKKLAEIYKSPYMDRFYRLNNPNITGISYDNNQLESSFKIKDINNNKLKIIKSIMNLLGIDRTQLLYNRKIISNYDLKTILQANTPIELIKYYNQMDTDKINTDTINITEFNSSNKKHFKYVKDIITSYLSYIGISHKHLNKHGGEGRDVYDNNECLIVFQYELYDKTNSTFINTYYDTIKNDIFYYLYKKQREINEIIDTNYLCANTMSKKKYKRIEKKFETRQKAIFKRNRYITIHTDNVVKQVKLPFNLLTAEYIVDNNNSIINLINMTENERIQTYLSIEYPSDTNAIYDIDDCNKKEHDIQYYKHTDIVWKPQIKINIGAVEKYISIPFNLMTTEFIYDKNNNYKTISLLKKDDDGNDVKKTKKERIDDYLSIEYPSDIKSITYDKNCNIDYCVRDVEEKYTTDKSKKDVVIENKNQTTKEIVGDILNDLIDTIVLKDEYKTMVNTEIKVGDEQNKIKKEYDMFKNNEIDTAQPNSNDIHFNILKPNIKVF